MAEDKNSVHADPISDPKTVYDITKPMMDISSFMYYYTELRSAANKRLLGYAILISKRAKRITVVFRGSVDANDWITNVQMPMVDLTLPGYTKNGVNINPKGDKRRDVFGKVHKGRFYDYLFGQTQEGDNGSDGSDGSKGEEIMGILSGLFAREKYKDFAFSWRSPQYHVCIQGSGTRQ